MVLISNSTHMAKGTENKIKYTIFPKASNKSFIVKSFKEGERFPSPQVN